MKKFILFLGAFLVLFAACKPKNQNVYTINGHLDDAQFDGKMVYLFDGYSLTVIDSALVENGTFVFSDTVSTPRFAFLLTSQEETPYYLRVVLEPGDIYADMITDSLSGTPLNDELYQYVNQYNYYSQEIQNAYEQYASIADTTESEAAKAQFDEKYEGMMSDFNQLVCDAFERNKTNILGVFFLMQWKENTQDLSLGKAQEMLQNASPEVVNHPVVLQMIEDLKILEKTSAGHPFVDLDLIEHKSGKMVKLSDMINGKIALIDFWASWCRPCRESIPEIARLHKQYGDKIVVISLNVSDQLENQAQVIEEMNMNWLQLADTTNNAITTYAVSGIPHVMLIGADGTILARNLEGADMEAAVKNALQK